MILYVIYARLFHIEWYVGSWNSIYYLSKLPNVVHTIFALVCEMRHRVNGEFMSLYWYYVWMYSKYISSVVSYQRLVEL